jgi:hypothetical protein
MPMQDLEMKKIAITPRDLKSVISKVMRMNKIIAGIKKLNKPPTIVPASKVVE